MPHKRRVGDKALARSPKGSSSANHRLAGSPEELRTFVSSEAKDYVRAVLDGGLIRQFRVNKLVGERLAYLGLPGEALFDVLSWRESLGRWTGVQVADSDEDRAVADEMERTMLRHRLEDTAHLVRGNIDELIARSPEESPLRWPYHVINLDYYGGLVNSRNDGSAAHLNALRALFRHQEGVPFLLLLSVSFRGDDGGELQGAVDKEEEDLAGLGLRGVQEAFSEHRDLGRSGLLMIYTPIFLAGFAPRHELTFHHIVRYQGTIPMMHFAVEASPFTALQTGRSLSITERIELINRPLLEIADLPPGKLIEFTQIDNA